MAKLTLSDLASIVGSETSAIGTINDNNALVETALENTLSRDGTSPNTMSADLDMDSNNILNLPEPATLTEPLRRQDIDTFITIPKIFVQATEPSGSNPDGSLWIDSDSINLDLYTLSSEVWTDSTSDLRGLQGPTGPSVFISFDFSSDITDTDPTSGKFKFDDGDVTAATQIFIHKNQLNGTSVGDWIDSWDASTSVLKGQVLFVNGLDSTKFVIFDVDNSITDATTYFKVPVVINAKSSITPFLDGEEISVFFSPAGDAGTGAVTSFETRTGAVVSVSGDYTASEVTNVAAGDIVATNVQAAIDELDTEKQPFDATLTSLSALGTAADKYAFTTGVDTWAEGDCTTAGRALLDDADAAAQRTTLGLGTIATLSSIATSNIDNNAVTAAKMAQIATDSFLGRDTAATGDVEVLSAATARTVLNVADGANAYVHPNHTGDVDSVADGTTTIAVNAVGNTKLADMSADTVKMRNNNISGDPQDVKISALVEEVSPAAGDWIIGEDAGGGIVKYNIGNLPTGGGGEANTASNQGVGGIGIFKSKVGIDLQFKNLNTVANETSLNDDTGNDEIDIGLADNLRMPGTEDFLPASGTTAQRDGTPDTGATRYNTTLNILEYYNGTSWIPTGQHSNGMEVFTSSGSFVKASSLPASVTHVIIECTGAGGGGNGSTSTQRASGGAGGGYAKARIAVSSLSASETVTVGAGGAGGDLNGTPGSQTGTAGGSSSLGVHCVATGGGGGTAALSAGAIPGDGTVGDILVEGSDVHIATGGTANGYEGGGAGAGPYGGGCSDRNIGTAARLYGAGGGAGNHTGGGGAAGADGIVVVSW